MTKVLHVKIPVTDLQRSVSWYCELLDLVAFREFVEQGALRGAALRSPEASFALCAEGTGVLRRAAGPGRV